MATAKTLSMTMDAYHAHPALSRSVLDKIRKSPSHLQHYLHFGQKDTEAFQQGRMIHTLLLEPEGFWERVCTFEGKVRRGKAWDEFEAANSHKEILKEADVSMLKGIQASFATKAMTKNILNGAAIEESIFWTDDETGIECKARPDFFKDGCVYDIKTSIDGSDDGFSKSAYRFGYHRQAAWYLDAVKHATGRMFSSFGFIVIEKFPPFEIQVFLASQELIERGRKENAENLALYARCKRENYWPGYPDSIQILDLPEWVK